MDDVSYFSRRSCRVMKIQKRFLSSKSNFSYQGPSLPEFLIFLKTLRSMLANFSINEPFSCGLISNDWRQSPTAYASGTEPQNASIIPITSYSDANRQFKSYNLAGTVQYLEKVSMLAPYIS